MSQNRTICYLNEIKDSVHLLTKYLDLLTFMVDTCKTDNLQDYERLLLMCEVYRSRVDCNHNEIKAIITRCKNEVKNTD